MDTFRDAISAMYYQMSMKTRELTAIDVTNSYICPPNLSISVVLYIPLIEILDEMFGSASNLLQDPASLVQCRGSKQHLAKSKSNPNQLHHIKLNEKGSFACYTIAQSLNSTEYAAIQFQLPKIKIILKNF